MFALTSSGHHRPVTMAFHYSASNNGGGVQVASCSFPPAKTERPSWAKAAHIQASPISSFHPFTRLVSVGPVFGNMSQRMMRFIV